MSLPDAAWPIGALLGAGNLAVLTSGAGVKDPAPSFNRAAGLGFGLAGAEALKKKECLYQ